MENVASKNIQLPTFLEVLGQLPDINRADFSTAKQSLQKAFGDSYSLAVEFSRGLKYGDGKIQAPALFRSEGGEPISTQVVISQEGLIQNSAAGFSANVSPLFARHFIRALFGAEELIGGTKSKEKERDANLESAELIWTWAGQLRESVRGAVSGDPDEIQAIMDRYAIYRNFADTLSDVHNAWIRVKRAREMIGEVRAYVADHTTNENDRSPRRDDDSGICRASGCYAEDMKMQREMEKGTIHKASDKEPPCRGRGCL